VTALGLLLASAGLLLTLGAAPVEAATVSCNGALATASLVPGDQGSCSMSYSETATQLGNPFTVTLDVESTSASGGGAAGSGTATEALLDGQATGLQVTITDSKGQSFGMGSASCSAVYPDAAGCSSRDDAQAVSGAVGLSAWSDTFTINWSLPLAAGNPYQGGSATVTVTPYYNGTAAPSASPTPAATPTGSVAAVTSSPSPTGGASPISTPTTGSGPAPTASLVLIALGMALLLLGACGVGWTARSRPPTP
jgi:hypothetical protein